jgi:hypothetical protein
MPHKLKIATDCTYFHKGYDRQDYAKGEEIETDDDEFAAVALELGWAHKAKSGKKEKDPNPADIPSAADASPDNPDPAAAE